MENFIYNTPTKVYFGKGYEKKVGEIISEYGFKKIMLQYGKDSIKKSGLYDIVLKSLEENGVQVVELGGVEPNPKIDFVRNAVAIAKKEKVEFILAVGGGSVLDSCKYTALGAMADCDVWDFAMGKEKPQKALKVGCVLTMSAAGSEMSSSAVVTHLEINMKKGCSTDLNRCLFAICNPELTYSVGEYQTACGVVDIMSHTLERYFTDYPDTEPTDSISESILKSVMEAGRKAIDNPFDYDARATIMWCSSLSHNGLTACGRENALPVHQLEHALSGEFDFIAHGAGLAVLFPAWAKWIYKEKPERFARLARNVFNVNEKDDLKASLSGIERMAEYFKSIGMPIRLREFNIPKESIKRLVELCTYGYTRKVKSYVLMGEKELEEIFNLSY